MTQYGHSLGKDVRVEYRAARAIHSSCGRMVRDTGDSIIIEERFDAHGNSKTARIEVPYNCVIHLEEIPARDDVPPPGRSA
jgi:hypothetical protein